MYLPLHGCLPRRLYHESSSFGHLLRQSSLMMSPHCVKWVSLSSRSSRRLSFGHKTCRFIEIRLGFCVVRNMILNRCFPLAPQFSPYWHWELSKKKNVYFGKSARTTDEAFLFFFVVSTSWNWLKNVGRNTGQYQSLSTDTQQDLQYSLAVTGGKYNMAALPHCSHV